MSNVELKNVKTSKFASEETLCFEASVYINGVKAGSVSNDGRGGCNMWHPWALEKQVEAIAKALPKFAKETFEVADAYVFDLLERIDVEKEVKRKMKTAVYFKGADGSLRITGKLTPVQLHGLQTDVAFAARNLEKMKGTKWLFDVNEIVDMMIEAIDKQRGQ